MYSSPPPTSIGTICPGSLVAKEIPPGAPMARYSVMNSDPPPATRFSPTQNHPHAPTWVCAARRHRKRCRAAAELGVRLDVDGSRHPRKFTGFRKDGFVGIEREFKYRHG